MPNEFVALGQTGLQRFGGLVNDEYLPELAGRAASDVYREMVDSDHLCGGLVYIIDKLTRRVSWRVAPASSRPGDVQAAEHFESCLYDMEIPWTDTVSEIMSMIPQGHSLHEIVLKRRGGNSKAKWLRSRYADGLIGIRGLPIRAQNTLARWIFDDAGDITGVEQIAPPNYKPVVIPMEKALLFRTSVHRNNPTGRSVFRHVYRAWYIKKTIEAFEAMGIERDNVGMPLFYMLEDYMRPTAQPHQKAVYEAVKRIGTNVKQDTQSVMCLPMDREGKKIVEYAPAGSPGSKLYDTDKIIQRWDQRMAAGLLADFILMGQSSSTTGSFSMHTDKTKMFALSLETFLDTVCEVINRRLTEVVTDLNGFDVSEYPRLEHGKVEEQDLAVLSDYLGKLSAAGMPLFPNRALEDHVMEVANLPLPEESETPAGIDGEDVVPAPGEDDEVGVPLPDADAPPDATPEVGAPMLGAMSASDDTKSVAQVTLNGAQVTSALAIVERVITGQMPRDSALAFLQVSFALTPEQAEGMLGSVGRDFVPATPIQAPVA